MEQTRVIIKDRLIELAKETVETLGFLCVEARIALQKGGRTLRVIIYRQGKDISMEDCSTVSSVILRRIELENPDFSENYDLVVESPGAERRFESLEEMLLFRDRDIRVVLREPGKYGLKDNVLVGRVVSSAEGSFRLSSGGKEYNIAWTDVSQTRLHFDMKKYL